MAEHETTADVIAAMRDEAARADMEQEYSIDDAAEMMREFAWRFEAAHERERGDMAKMREAVKKLLDALYDMGIDENTLEIAVESPNCQMKSEHTLSVLKEVHAALDEPRRNCDRPECATTRPRRTYGARRTEARRRTTNGY